MALTDEGVLVGTNFVLEGGSQKLKVVFIEGVKLPTGTVLRHLLLDVYQVIEEFVEFGPTTLLLVFLLTFNKDTLRYCSLSKLTRLFFIF